jgi:hypothetical protein
VTKIKERARARSYFLENFRGRGDRTIIEPKPTVT